MLKEYTIMIMVITERSFILNLRYMSDLTNLSLIDCYLLCLNVNLVDDLVEELQFRLGPTMPDIGDLELTIHHILDSETNESLKRDRYGTGRIKNIVMAGSGLLIIKFKGENK